ncbi:MAG TPA: ribonuclease HII [Acidimicrobiales bacterium]|jgi:ribonuclease HII|nr:ribonuclease HII [Acidimicrobiales bacterium]
MATKAGARRATGHVRDANLRLERSLLREGHALVGGLDEVGRGAWAGPMFVGVVLVDASTKPAPSGTRDSKMLTSAARHELTPALTGWCVAWSIGEVSAAEIDELGLTAALGVAARRALDALPARPTCLIVDGKTDFVTLPGRLDLDQVTTVGAGLEVRPVVRADARCGSVAAASVLAKVARDDLMVDLAGRYPAYRFDQHKGYGTPEHAAAIADHGLTDLHRRTWAFVERVTTLGDDDDGMGWDEGADHAPSTEGPNRLDNHRSLAEASSIPTG